MRQWGQWFTVVSVLVLAAFLLSAPPIGPAPAADIPPRPVLVGKRPGPPEPPANDIQFRPVPTVNDYARAGLEYLLTLTPYEARYTRLLMIRDGERLEIKSKSLIMAFIKRTPRFVRPIPVAGGFLLAFNLTWYWSQPEDLEEAQRAWEELAFDYKISRNVTKGQIDFAALAAGVEAKDVVVRLFGAEVTVRKQVDVVRLDGEHLDPELFSRLRELTYSQAPLVDSRYFAYRAFDSADQFGAKKNEVYAALWGGLYYDFRGIKKTKQKGATDLDDFLERHLLLGSTKNGIKVKDLFFRARTDQRVIISRSKVTHKKRWAVGFNSAGSKVKAAWGALTGDISDDAVDVMDDPFDNLVDPRADAREGIWTVLDGYLIYVLYNEQEALQKIVPPNVALYHDLPSPYPKQFGSGWACYTCHGRSPGAEGWQPIGNDVPKLLGRLRFDVLFDLTVLQKDNQFRSHGDLQDRLVGLYDGNFDDHLALGRDVLARSVLLATNVPGTGEWPGPVEAIVRLTADRLYEERIAYWYRDVDAAEALYDMGLEVKRGDAVAVLNMVLLPDARAFDGKFLPEDSRLARLKAGLTLSRADWGLSYSTAAERVQRSPVFLLLRGEIPWF